MSTREVPTDSRSKVSSSDLIIDYSALMTNLTVVAGVLAVLIGAYGKYMDSLTFYTHYLVDNSGSVVPLYQAFCLLQFPHAMPLIVASQAVVAAERVYKHQNGANLYWLHSLILVVLTGFGGGMVAPVLIGKPPLFYQNELIVPLCIVAWYVTCVLGLPFLYPRPSLLQYFSKMLRKLWPSEPLTPLLSQEWATSTLPAQLFWGLLNALFRTHAVCNVVKAASLALPAGPYYPCALVGPILSGALLGSCGAFLPWDKGLAPVSNGMPWPMQAALMTSVFYKLQCLDDGWAGAGFRAVLGSYDDSGARVVIVSVQVASMLLQLLLHESANLFTPFHKALYLLSGARQPVQLDQKPPVLVPASAGKGAATLQHTPIGWPTNTRFALERCIEVGRVLLVLLVLLRHVYSSYPPSVLLPGMRVGVGKSLGVCQMPVWRGACAAATLSVVEGAAGVRVVGYAGKAGEITAASTHLSFDVRVPAKDVSSAYLTLSTEGTVSLVGPNDAVYWQRKTPGCATEAGREKAGAAGPRLAMVKGVASVVCGELVVPLKA